MSFPPCPRTVLVTGAARRLGREFCLAFARAGWSVVCHYQHSQGAALRTCAEVQALGQRAWAVAADLAEPAQLAQLFAQVVQLTGQAPDALVNNASLFDPDSGIDLSGALLQQQLQVNLAAPLQLASLLAQQLRAEGGARQACVVHVLDQKVFNLNPDYFSYTVSKLALERAVALQAQALAPAVRVVGIAPGLLYPSGPQSAANFERAACVNLLRRPTDPLDVARTAVFLADNPAITGVTVCVDSGQHLVPLARDVMFLADEGAGAAP